MEHEIDLPEAPRPGGARRAKGGGRRATYTVAQRLDMGARVAAWAQENPEVGRMRWGDIAEGVFNMKYSPALAKRLKRAYLEWSTSAAGGKHTAVAAGAETRERRRRLPDELETISRHKGDSISYELLQWFVDEIEAVKSRADSRLMLDHARWLRAQLVSTSA